MAVVGQRIFLSVDKIHVDNTHCGGGMIHFMSCMTQGPGEQEEQHNRWGVSQVADLLAFDISEHALLFDGWYDELAGVHISRQCRVDAERS